MATKEFPLVPEKVAPVHTKYRRIVTDIPAPGSIPLLQRLRDLEPRSMGGQPPVVWDHGSGFSVSDAYGNTWLDFSSGVLVTACGHARPEIVQAIQAQAARCYHSYCFPTEARLRLIEEISSILPAPLKRVFLLTTGAEATECCIKLARTQGLAVGGSRQEHPGQLRAPASTAGRWAPSGPAAAGPEELAGPAGRAVRPGPLPRGLPAGRRELRRLREDAGAPSVGPQDVCGVMGETYQGANAALLPKQYAQDLRRWCDAHQAVLILDEVQAAFGRCGKWFGFQHLGIVPDLAACGKGISGGMPLSAVVGTEELMNIYGPGEMTSTHSGNAVCAAAAAANIQVLKKDKLIENAAALAPTMAEGRRQDRGRQQRAHRAMGRHGPGLRPPVHQEGHQGPRPRAGLGVRPPGDSERHHALRPRRHGRLAIKVNPPLCITEEALREGLGVLEGVAKEV